MSLFEKNLLACRNSYIVEKLLTMQKSKFKLIPGADPLDLNIQNTHTGRPLYQNPLKETQAMLERYEEEYPLYPVLYFYGFGNGLLFKALLQSPHHKFIVVFEEDVELLYTLFHALDFSAELAHKLIILDSAESDIEIYQEIFSNFITWTRLYFLEPVSDYYANDALLNLSSKLSALLFKLVVQRGNDSKDALQGLQQNTLNLPQMIARPTFQELLAKRRGLCESAIIVSTGPSLTKQLPLLKEVQDRALIFAADSAYPILYQNAIKPDFVLSTERIAYTSEFFNNDFGKFNEGIIFCIKSLTHPNTLSYLKDRAYMLVWDGNFYSQSLGLHQWGYFNIAGGVSNMAHNLAFELGVKNIILIGQDLAYAEDLTSHPEGYLYGVDDMDEAQEHKENVPLEAYGGEGTVRSSRIWSVFKTLFENSIIVMQKSGVRTINATEGGARIVGSVEMPFSEACERFFSAPFDKKSFSPLLPLSKEKQKEFSLKAYFKVMQNIKACGKFCADLQKLHTELILEQSKLQTLGLDEGIRVLKGLNERVDGFKNSLETLEFSNLFLEILIPYIFQFECNLAKFYVLNPKTKEDVFNKNALWFKEHLEFMESVFYQIQNQAQTLVAALVPLEDSLEKHGLRKYRDKIKQKLERAG
ncbi:motility associated factor glycosyltransferase family protein [Campylobacter sp.]|uniref:motility associated factor glycosyltransferase family protein n=1 Tax=Campylobacter sp. TaxID=205 RepID=UPI0026DB7562|nr:motility associated factor glycosyltransferase family protein [Campylobacter sp.]MDO4674474.1 motility associated factor glycosyltransferase family protein [Campylobacter sp.]